jgi:hypothetical protein
MARSVVVHNVATALAGNALQLATLLRQRAGLRNAAVMFDNALQFWPMLRCNVFFFFKFFIRQLEEKKKMGEREKF